MLNKFIYTPGPTNVLENVRMERAKETTNPDLDLDFVEFYKDTCEEVGQVINTKNTIYILAGEGILGLEAACASLTEKDDKVLVIDNGIFGHGFADFVEMYGGKVTFFESDYNKGIDVERLSEFLKENHDFKYATLVHCDTPTGVLNPIDKICPLLKSYGIISVVDSVSAMGGVDLKVDEWKIDIILGGSQKVFSAPTGLTIVGISDDAKKIIENRKTPVTGFYCNLNIWKNYYEDKWFPYTMPISCIQGFKVALDNILNEGKENVIKRHEVIAKAVRNTVKKYGLELFLEDNFSNTVTVVKIPKEIGSIKLINHIENKYNVIMSSSLDQFKNEVIRIGHMGTNANVKDTMYALDIIDKALKDLGFESNNNMVNIFKEELNNANN